MKAPKRPSFRRADHVFNKAKGIHDRAEKFIQRHEKQINKGFERSQENFRQTRDQFNHNVKRAEEIVGHTIDRLSPVSDKEVDSVLREFAQPSTAALLKQAPSVKHLPEPRITQQAAPAPTVKPMPHSERTDAHQLTQERQQFQDQRHRLSARATSTTALLSELEKAVKLIDETYNTKSLDYLSQLKAQHQELQKEIKGANELDPKGRAELKEKIQNYKEKFEKYTAKVAGVLENHVIKLESSKAENTQDTSSHSTPRPGRR